MKSVFAVVLLATGVAHADPTAEAWPTEVTQRPLTLAPRMLELRGDTVDIDLSAGHVGTPVSLSPSLFFGVAAGMTVGITHPVPFVGAPGVCVTGTTHGCAHVYDSVAAEAYHSVIHGAALDVATHPAFEVLGFSPVLFGLRVAATVRYRVGRIAFVVDPGILFGLDKRGKGNATELVSLPAQVQFQVASQLELHLAGGIAGSLADPSFGDSYAVPLGAGATFAISHALDVGGDFAFSNLRDRDARALVVRAAWRH